MTEERLHLHVLADTGPLVAIFRAVDQNHEACVDTLKSIAPPLLTSWPVITEAAWLLRDRPRAVHRLLESPAAGFLKLLPLDEAALPELAALARKYHKLRPQLADLTLVHLAQREGIDTIFTLDRRDFAVLRGPGGRAFRLLP